MKAAALASAVTLFVVHVCCEADIVKEIFKVMPKFSDTPMPPLDEEMLADLAKIPAKLDGECQPW